MMFGPRITTETAYRFAIRACNRSSVTAYADPSGVTMTIYATRADSKPTP
jgi:hypothetical protein